MWLLNYIPLQFNALARVSTTSSGTVSGLWPKEVQDSCCTSVVHKDLSQPTPPPPIAPTLKWQTSPLTCSLSSTRGCTHVICTSCDTSSIDPKRKHHVTVNRLSLILVHPCLYPHNAYPSRAQEKGLSSQAAPPEKERERKWRNYMLPLASHISLCTIIQPFIFHPCILQLFFLQPCLPITLLPYSSPLLRQQQSHSVLPLPAPYLCNIYCSCFSYFSER